MKNLEDFLHKNLSVLVAQAREEATGMALDAIRLPTGERVVCFVCATKASDIARLIDAFSLHNYPRLNQDFTKISLFDLLKIAQSGSGFTAVMQFADDGSVDTLALISAEPVSMQRLEALIDMPD